MDILNLHSLLGSAEQALRTAMLLALAIGVLHSLVCFLRMPSERASQKRRSWRSSGHPSPHTLPAAGHQTTSA